MLPTDPSMPKLNPDDGAAPAAALSALARAALDYYPVSPDSRVSLLNLSENAMFRVDAPDGACFVLRLHRPGYHTPEAIASELAWAVALRQAGVVTTPSPVAGRNGAPVQQIAQPGAGQPRNAVLFHWETGAEPSITDRIAPHVETLGEIAARMHLHARQWAPPTGFTRHTWDVATSLGDDTPHWGRWRDALGMTPAREHLFQRTVDVISRRLAAYGKGADRFGLIHADLRLANLLIDGHAVKVIDFDDCGFGWYMYDAATVISFYEHTPQAPDLIEAWKTGYRRVTPIASADEAEIPTLIMLRRILLTAWIASHSEAEFPKSLGAGYTEQGLVLCDAYLGMYS
jgi:Ser/Thr protein kinase RdoA (MazF antagonist)